MSGSAKHEDAARPSAIARFGRTELDVLVMGITYAAIILFVGNGGAVFSKTIIAAQGLGFGPDRLLSTALLLNIAIVMFGWTRYGKLHAELNEHRQAEEVARQLAETDPLTGCLNRRSMRQATENLIEGATGRGEAVAVIMIDIDKFKLINDINGHAVGDRLLCECAERSRLLLPPGALLARLGGDEFACVVPFNPRRPEQIDHFAAALIRSVSAPMSVAGYEGHVTASLGISRSDGVRQPGDLMPADPQATPATPDHLLHMADIAMYQAKKQGRNQYLWFEGEMATELRYRNELENAIRLGIAEHEFVPYYEQQIDLLSGELVGFEMLARWQSPKLGMIGPEVFIPIAEEIGVIGELSESVIAQALHDARDWHPRLTLSVNISPVQLRDPWFAQKILKMLVAANFPPNRLDIEITESSLHQNIAGVHALITSLKNQGVGISLDDFGTGYSSLAQLRNLPFDRLKIDRSFVMSMVKDKDSASIVQIISSLGESFGLPMTAEGIESPEILEKLSTIGKFKGQGYLYGKPAPAADVVSMLAVRKLLVVDAGAGRNLGTGDGKDAVPGSLRRSA